MTATNHAVTGALIGLLIGQPAIALPAAFLSHFVMDGLPHYGSSDSLASVKFKVMLLLDAGACVALVLLLVASHPAHWLLAATCAFLAASPDFLWIRKFAQAHKMPARPYRPNRLENWLGPRLQWFQRPIGAFVELAWLVGTGLLLSAFLLA